MEKSKPRLIKDYENHKPEIQEQIKLAYPHGFQGSLISYKDQKGVKRTALPFETEDIYYLVRMSIVEARQIIVDDDDFDDDGNLKDDIKTEYEDKYSTDDIDDVEDDSYGDDDDQDVDDGED